MNETPRAPFYVVGGTMAPGSPSYIRRRADDELLEAVLAGEFCYVLTARQMGKSSLMARTVHRLREIGVDSAVVDLTQIGGAKSGINTEQWYYGIAHAIHRQLKPGVDTRAWWRERADLHAAQRFAELLRALVHEPERRRMVIFVDEIDATIDLPFSDEFFAAVRACYNARSLDGAFARLTFVLLGVSTPQELIHDQAQTPFNIGRSIELTDFTIDEALPLAGGMRQQPGVQAEALLRRVMYWTDGQPYLTQSLCRSVGDAVAGDDVAGGTIVDRLVERRYLTDSALRDDHNLKFISARLTAAGMPAELLDLYGQIVSGEAVANDATSPAHAELRLAGVVKTDPRGHLTVRNRIYARVFTAAWAAQQQAARRRITGYLQAGSVIGEYKITEQLGAGGESLVFLATRLHSGTPVVIKQQEAVGDKAVRSRWLREAQVLSPLGHPNVAKVYEFVEHADRVFKVMEYLPGGSLAEVISLEGRVAEQQACRWCRDALSGLDAAHMNGIVHRNIKPSNLMFDSTGRIKVTDFGVARFFGDARLTRTGSIVGTPAYMSPEQIMTPENIYHQTDIYSMGVVLYELLTGRVPFEADSEFSTYQAIVRDTPKPIRAINPRVSRRLEAIVLRALEKDPGRRYGGAGEFAAVLEDYLDHAPWAGDSGPSTGLFHRLYRATRRTLAGTVFKGRART